MMGLLTSLDFWVVGSFSALLGVVLAVLVGFLEIPLKTPSGYPSSSSSSPPSDPFRISEARSVDARVGEDGHLLTGQIPPELPVILQVHFNFPGYYLSHKLTPAEIGRLSGLQEAIRFIEDLKDRQDSDDLDEELREDVRSSQATQAPRGS